MNVKLYVALATLAALTSAASLPAAADDDGSNPCGAVMCLFGEATGNGGGSGCDKYVNPYYQINVFEDGFFRPDKTAEQRMNYLKGCKSADNNSLQVANTNGGNQYGPNPTTPTTPTKPVPPTCGKNNGLTHNCELQ